MPELLLMIQEKTFLTRQDSVIGQQYPKKTFLKCLSQNPNHYKLSLVSFYHTPNK